jgi:hypothetical protein
VSALTKIFVVLLVILSLLLSAATIVFVNTQTTTVAALDAVKKDRDMARKERDSAVATHTAEMAKAQEALTAKDNEINQLRNDNTAAAQQIAQRDAQNAELTANLAAATVNQSTLGDAVKTAQAALDTQHKSYEELRNTFDKQQKMLVDLNLRVDDLTNVADVRGRGLKVSQEEVAQLKQDLTKANDVIRKNGLPTVDSTGVTAINPEPAINVTARVRETREIGGVRYATIDVGSAESIQKNMQLSVTDSGGKRWLGYIVVDQVNPHDAIGRIDGPGANQVQPGAVVRSRL